MKKRHVALAILLIIIAIFAVSQAIKQEEIPPELRKFITGAKGVSENMYSIIYGTSDEEIGLAMSGTIRYFVRSIAYADALECLPAEEVDEFKLSQAGLKQSSDEVHRICEKYEIEGHITDEDQELLKSVQNSLESFLYYVYEKYGYVYQRFGDLPKS